MILNSWKEIDLNSDFSIYNLPFGIFSTSTLNKRVGIAIGNEIIDLRALTELNILEIDNAVLHNEYLNDFIALGKTVTNAVRLKIQEELCDESSPLKTANVFIKQSEATMHLPIKVGDYTDFYSSIEHATNVGKMFRDPENALLPNWKHIPVGYHGRASSIIVSGQNIKRPCGQVMPKDATAPVYQASGRVDFELEMAFIIGKGNDLGSPISTADAEDHIFGMALFNDWSARDIQKWEYVPLGPFLGKSFASTLSPWIVTLEALDHFRVEGPKQEPAVLPYLEYNGLKNFDINLEVGIHPEGTDETIVSRSNYKYMYWNMVQQLAHHTVNGCNMKIGDLLASGTISGKDENSYGSMLEIAWAGTKPVKMKDGTERKFINNGDTVNMKAWAEKDGKRVGFGGLTTKILPANPLV